jgi:hypothetical protein
VLARRSDALDVIQEQQVRLELICGGRHVGQVERRPDEAQPVGHRFQGLHAVINPLGMLPRELPGPDQRQVHARQPGQLPVEQHGRPHLDTADAGS